MRTGDVIDCTRKEEYLSDTEFVQVRNGLKGAMYSQSPLSNTATFATMCPCMPLHAPRACLCIEFVWSQVVPVCLGPGFEWLVVADGRWIAGSDICLCTGD